MHWRTAFPCGKRLSLIHIYMWAASGKPDLYGQARERAKEILATHKQKNPLSPEQVNAIRDVLVDAEGELGVADFWKGKEEKRFIDNDLY